MMSADGNDITNNIVYIQNLMSIRIQNLYIYKYYCLEFYRGDFKDSAMISAMSLAWTDSSML